MILTVHCKTFTFLVATPHITKIQSMPPTKNMLVDFACGHYRVITPKFVVACRPVIPVCDVAGCTLDQGNGPEFLE